MNEFWAVVDQARADAAAAGGPGWPSGSAIGAALVERLAQLPPERIVEFYRCYEHADGRADAWDLCAAAFLIWDYVSEDGFSDFKAGLVGLGRDSFERVVADADALADLPLVRAIAKNEADRFEMAGEAIQSAAPQAYGRRTGDPEAFWEALDNLPAEPDDDDPRPGERWSGRFGSPEDTARIPSRLPRLHDLFATRYTDSA